MAILFAVFQSFDQNCSFSHRGQFIIDSQTVTRTTASAPRANMMQPQRSTKTRPVNQEKQRCDVCNREFNSNLQALSHFRGASHNEEVVRRAHSSLALQNMHNGEQLFCT